jgi:hypothetical protein
VKFGRFQVRPFQVLLPICLLIASISAVSASSYNYSLQWGSAGSADGQFNYPIGICVDSQNHVYVTELYGIGRVQEFDGDGNFVKTLVDWEGVGGSRTFGIAVDNAGNFFMSIAPPYYPPVLDYGWVFKYNSSLGFVTGWGYQGGDTSLGYPSHIAVDSLGNVYVNSHYNNTIQKFDNDGNFLLEWGGLGYPDDGKFLDVSGIAVDKDGYVYVCDQVGNRTQKFDSNGNFVLKWGSTGSGNGQFEFPYGVAVDSNGNVCVSDSLNNRVQIFDNNGNFLSSFGTAGAGNGQFNGTMGIATNNVGSIYVIDLLNSRVQKFVFQPDTAPTLPFQQDVTVENNTYTIAGSSNSTISDISFDSSLKELRFNTSGETGTNGFCNIQIPNALMWGDLSVYRDDVLLVNGIDYTQSSNATHTIFQINYSHSSHTIKIVATEAIPEFPSVSVMLAFLIIISCVVAIVNSSAREIQQSEFKNSI